MKKFLTYFYSLIFIIVVASCMSKPATSAQPQKSVDITGKVWKLTEINGQLIKLKNPQTNPYFSLNKREMRYEGHGGCNGISGTFEIKQEVMRIKFNQGVSTMIACEDLDIERAFTQALLSADNYSVNGNTLTLNRARIAPLAKFVLQK